MSASNGRFHAGPSFLDYDRPDVRMAQLPAWLQTFAVTVGDPGEDWPMDDGMEQRRTENSPRELAVTAGHGDQLSTWFDGAESEAPPKASEANGSIIDPAFMISEEDLPDWLRAIEPGEGEDALGAGMEAGTSGVRIPAVSRAWVPDGDDGPAIDESASVFALLATQGPQPALSGAREAQRAGDQFHALEQSGPAFAHVAGRGGATTVGSKAGRDGADDAGQSDQGTRLLRMLLLVALIVLIVLVVMFLL